MENEENLMSILEMSDGRDNVIIYLRTEKQKKILPPAKSVKIDEELLNKLKEIYGEKNIAVD